MFFGLNSNARLASRLLGGTSAGVIALIAPAALAQDNAAPALETVTVTGTLIKGINPVGTNIVTVDTTNIQQRGLLTTDQILTEIPQITNTFDTLANPTTNASNFQALRPSIRNIPSTTITGGTTTLVLVDGHNWVGVNSLGTAIDPGILPAGVLQRVDVMPDGASSMYGANAITGVINFITRSSYDGLKISTSVGAANGYWANDESVMFGESWKSGNAYVAFENKGNSFLMSNSRPEYTQQDLTSIGGRNSLATACALPNITAGANNYAQTALVANVPGLLKANVTGPFGALNTTTNSGNGFNRCDTTPNSTIVPKEEGDALFMGFSQHILPGIELTGKMIWSSRWDDAVANQLSATTTIDNTNPYFQSINGETAQTIQFSFSPYFAENSGSSKNTGQNYVSPSIVQVFQFTPNLHVDLPLGDWEANIMANYGRSYSWSVTRSVNTTLLGQVSRKTNPAAPNLVADPVLGNAIDPYNITLTDPTLLQTLTAYGNIGKSVQHQDQLQATADGSLFDWWGGTIKAAVGFKYSFEGYQSFWSVNSPLAQQYGATIVGGQLVYAQTKRILSSEFGEINIPVVGDNNAMPFVKKLEFDISGRSDSYSDFGDAKTYKLGFTYMPFDELSIRGNKGQSFDAPSLADTLAPDGRYSYSPQRTSPNTNVPVGTSATDALRPSISVPGGNPNLGPENANTNSIGADFTPGDYGFADFTGLELSATLWHILIEHQIGLPSASGAGGLLFTLPAFSQYYMINPTIAQIQARYGYSTAVGFPGLDLLSAYPVSLGGTAPNGSINAPYILTDARRNNLGNALLEGIDFKISYTRAFDFGTITAGLSGTDSLRSKTQADATQPFVSIQAQNVPLYQVSANLGIVTGPLSVRGSWNYSPSYVPLSTATSVTLYHMTRIGSFGPVNLTVSYDLQGLTDWTSGTNIAMSVTNVFDEHPPIVLSGGTANGSTLGRYVQMSLVKQF